jgi:hypothetical protein
MGLPLQNFINKVGPAISASWLNLVDRIQNATQFNSAGIVLNISASAVALQNENHTGNAPYPSTYLTGNINSTGIYQFEMYIILQTVNSAGLSFCVTFSGGSFVAPNNILVAGLYGQVTDLPNITEMSGVTGTSSTAAFNIPGSGFTNTQQQIFQLTGGFQALSTGALAFSYSQDTTQAGGITLIQGSYAKLTQLG